jgi:hypothetical protein
MTRKSLVLVVVDGCPILDTPDPRKSAGELLYDVALRLRDYDDAAHIKVEIVVHKSSLTLARAPK